MDHLTFRPAIYPKQTWRRPGEYREGVGWIQDAHKRRVKKPHYHFIWPKDGKNGSKMGRLRDIATGRGPDMHVTISADKMDYMANRQNRSRWARHTNLDDRGPDGILSYELPWVRPHRRHRPDLRYDFGTRTYRRADHSMMTDARWYDVPRKQFPYPRAWRDIYGDWTKHDPWAVHKEAGLMPFEEDDDVESIFLH